MASRNPPSPPPAPFRTKRWEITDVKHFYGAEWTEHRHKLFDAIRAMMLSLSRLRERAKRKRAR